jgi:hypothetical protein
VGSGGSGVPWWPLVAGGAAGAAVLGVGWLRVRRDRLEPGPHWT